MLDSLDKQAIAAGQDEKALIAAMLVGPSNIDEIAASVSGADFSDRLLGQVFSLVVDLSVSGQPVSDPKVVCSALSKSGLLKELGGSFEVARLADSGIPSSGLFHAHQVRLASEVRRLRLQIARASSMLDSGDMDLACSTLSAAVQAAKQIGLEPIISAGDAVQMAVDRIEDARARNESIGIPSGMPELDKIIGGFVAGELTILGARPSIGKSVVGAEIAQRIAEAGRQVLFVSLEMTNEQLGQRFASRKAGISLNDLRDCKVDTVKIARLRQAACEIREIGLHLWSQPNTSLQSLRAAASICRAQHGLDIVVVDYLGLLSHPGEKTYERITQISRGLKLMAMELDVPFLVLVQLNRNADGKQPTLADIRDSGAIEQDADLVMFLHRERRDSKEALLDIAKFRNGAIGEIA